VFHEFFVLQKQSTLDNNTSAKKGKVALDDITLWARGGQLWRLFIVDSGTVPKHTG